MCSDWLKCAVTIIIVVIVLYRSVNHLTKLMTSSTLWRVRCVTRSCDMCVTMVTDVYTLCLWFQLLFLLDCNIF